MLSRAAGIQTDGSVSLSPSDLEITPALVRFVHKCTCTCSGIAKLKVVGKFSSGTSNPTYLLQVCDKHAVLRKKPEGELLPNAHQIRREYDVISRLAELRFPVPQPLGYCADTQLLGTEFYLMSYVPGRVFHDATLSALTPSERVNLSLDVLRVLVQLHSFPVDQFSFLRSNSNSASSTASSYVQRQVRAWYRNYSLSQGKSAVMRQLNQYLMDNAPTQHRECLIHGDFKLDQFIVASHEPKIISVLDWELVTIGDPIADLAYYCSPAIFAKFNGNLSVGEGIPTDETLLWHYCNHFPGLWDKISPKWKLYQCFAMFKVVCIFQSIHNRVERGVTPAAADVDVKLIDRFIAAAAHYAGFNDLNHESSLCIPPLSVHAFELLDKLSEFFEHEIVPNESVYEEQLESARNRFSIPPILEELKQKAKAKGLWNLFLPQWSNISNRDYAALAEVMGRNLWAAECFNCQFPDTGNMETLHLFGNDTQQRQWLDLLTSGVIRSSFVMTEPGVASSDATSLKTKIERRGSSYCINGSKWWISGAGDPRCKVFLVLGQTSDDLQTSRHRRHSIVIVPTNTPGVRIKTPMTVFGYDDAPYGHMEVDFVDVIVPIDNLLGKEGMGFEIAQARLGPGRLHHCMRTIGLAQRALEITASRLKNGVVGQPQGRVSMQQLQSLRFQLAQSRVELDQARLLVLRAATLVDQVGAKNARKLISMCKVAVPNVALSVIDNAIQAHGAVGLSHQLPLAKWYARTRTVRFMDGPDSSHLEVIAKEELAERTQAAKL
jgi:alkylation response protein AidB-like acyl-CoA dehydrogenase/aminoglycoside phosphotransferase (APT) family kinase protein